MTEVSVASVLEPGRNCWRIEPAPRAAVVIDAADYFRFVRQAMLKAERQILLIGWDFDTRIHLARGNASDGLPVNLGNFISKLAREKPALHIHILKWDTGALKLLGRGSTVFRVLRWMTQDRIHFRLDGAHPSGASHHQKIVVIDDEFAFCGGIDMTGSRWDTSEHKGEDTRRKRPFTKRSYGPWHDVSMAVDGSAAKALGELGRQRWQVATEEVLSLPPPNPKVWPDGLAPQFEDVRVAIARTRGAHRSYREIREVEGSFIDLIRSAQKFVYVETQFFASRAIATEILKRLEEEDGPEFVLVNPIEADTWSHEEVMGAARTELLKAIDPDNRHPRFRIYTPVADDGTDIYVHAKVMIVDDLVLRVGSANMNNRSMGFDSECDLIIDARDPHNRDAAPAIRGLRNRLMAEHLGVAPELVDSTLNVSGSLVGTVENLRGDGRSLKPFSPPDWNELERVVANSEVLDPRTAQ